jgi:hypothetical protein
MSTRVNDDLGFASSFDAGVFDALVVSESSISTSSTLGFLAHASSSYLFSFWRHVIRHLLMSAFSGSFSKMAWKSLIARSYLLQAWYALPLL